MRVFKAVAVGLMGIALLGVILAYFLYGSDLTARDETARDETAGDETAGDGAADTAASRHFAAPTVDSILERSAVGAGERARERARDGARDRCRHASPLRQAFYGDLHVHTGLSLDAGMQGTKARPSDAYRYAKGERLGLPPFDSDGQPMHYAQIARPLDFAAVTDHAELLGESHICGTPGAAGYDNFTCKLYRQFPRVVGLRFNQRGTAGEHMDFCGEGGVLCREAALIPWREIQQAAEEAYDRSADCSFSSFVGYEWTSGEFVSGSNLIANLHRNVIFKNDWVPRYPISVIEAKTATVLRQQLDSSCTQNNNDCDALIIPHNSNISLGQMFSAQQLSALDNTELARRARLEPLVEMIQHKGSSECFFGAQGAIAADELCDFEQLPWNSFMGNTFPIFEEPPAPSDGFIREVLREGLRTEKQRGVNPFKVGFIGSTDTHRALAGGTEENSFQGHGGAGNAAPEQTSQGLPDEWEFNPGGLAVLYAEENTRESLFAAMQRRESYATSGPRIGVRFFAGQDFPEDICARSDYLELAYKQGVPMGGDLVVDLSGDLSGDLNGGLESPQFVVSAIKDPGTRDRVGTDLQRIQIIKGWVDEQGVSQERVVEVAGNPSNGASVDLASCQSRGTGYKSLCSVWRDTEFNPQQQAYYYARVVENPSCRWSTYVCNAQGVDCSRPETLTDETAVCCSDDLKKTLQERAWTSPIWYSPGVGGG